MDDEMKPLNTNQTWDLAPLPTGKKAVNNKWVYWLKKEHNVSKKYKARLVVKGCQQRKNVDYKQFYLIFSSCENDHHKNGVKHYGSKRSICLAVRC